MLFLALSLALSAAPPKLVSVPWSVTRVDPALADIYEDGLARALRSHGLQPGRDISLIGVDGHDMSELLDLTTVVQPVHDLGRIAAEALLLQLRQPGVAVSAESIRLPTQLVVRGSTAPHKA